MEVLHKEEDQLREGRNKRRRGSWGWVYRDGESRTTEIGSPAAGGQFVCPLLLPALPLESNLHRPHLLLVKADLVRLGCVRAIQSRNRSPFFPRHHHAPPCNNAVAGPQSMHAAPLFLQTSASKQQHCIITVRTYLVRSISSSGFCFTIERTIDLPQTTSPSTATLRPSTPSYTRRRKIHASDPRIANPFRERDAKRGYYRC